tara:strand:- start:12 stop:1589 length:1578 start_codon:yes stop_codon:yes gene_type:complete
MSFTPTNFKLREGKEQSYTAATIVGIYGYNEATDKMQHIKVSDNQNIQVESMELDFDGYAQVLLDSSAATAVLADSTISAEIDPEGRGGWCFANSVAGSKYNLYYFNGAEEPLALGDVSSVYSKMYIDQKPDNSVMPLFQIYTKPTGVGDAGPFYHSRITYRYDASDGVVGIGESMIFYAINEPKKAWSERKMQFTSKSVLGDGLPDEEVLYMVVGSNSAATTGGVRHCVNLLGFNSGSGIQRNLNLKTSESSGGGSAGAATEAKQDTQITELQIIAADTTNTAANTLSTAADVSGINGKITTGAETTLSQAQQVLVYGEVTSGPGTGELHPIHITNAGDVEVEIADFVKGQELMADSFPVVLSSDQSTISVDVSGFSFGDGSDQLELPRNTSYGLYNNTTLKALKTDFNGKLLTQVDAQRSSGSETIVIPNGTTGFTSEISMGTHKFIAFYGDTDNNTNNNIFIEYSQDGVNWFRGAGANAKIIIVSATGNFYDEEQVTPPRVRLSRPNTSGSVENFTLYYTQL